MQIKNCSYQRIVFKFGTRILTEEDGGLATTRLTELISDMKSLLDEGKEILIVTSGAVGLGRKALNLQPPLTLDQKQACAAIGQGLLMGTYEKIFSLFGFKTAQILITAQDLSERVRYLNLKKTLETLLKYKVVPIINENDTVSTSELKESTRDKSFGDNDKLSAIVAAKLDTDLLVILTDVDGIYSENPHKNPEAKKIPLIQSIEELKTISTSGKSSSGRGGMHSKLLAVQVASYSRVTTAILSGYIKHPIKNFFAHASLDDPQRPGTLILPRAEGPSSTLSDRKKWIGFSSGFSGVLIVDPGAKRALQKNASLLPVGVKEVKGEFEKGSVLSIQDEEGSELGRGVSLYNSEEAKIIKGKKRAEILSLLKTPENMRDEMIHKDDLVIFEEENGEE